MWRTFILFAVKDHLGWKLNSDIVKLELPSRVWLKEKKRKEEKFEETRSAKLKLQERVHKLALDISSTVQSAFDFRFTTIAISSFVSVCVSLSLSLAFRIYAVEENSAESFRGSFS